MTAALTQLPAGRLQFFDTNNNPLAGGTVETYIPGTFTLVDTYTDITGATVNTHPIVLDALGSCAIWTTGQIRQIVWDAGGVQLWDVVSEAPASTSGTLQAANNLSDVASASAARTNLGLGTAATVNTGTSGATVGLLNGANTISGANNYVGPQTFSAAVILNPPFAAFAGVAVGYLGVPQVAQATNYTFAIADAGSERFFTANANATIPPNASVAFPIGTVLQATWANTFSGSLVQGAGVTLRWLTGNVTGNRTITGPGFVVIKQQLANEWWIVGGSGVS